MPLFSITTAIRQLTKIKLLIAVMLFSATGLNAQESVYLKNHWTREYISFWLNPLGKHIEFFLDPLCTYIFFTGTEPNSGREVYRSTKFIRSKGVKIYLDGTINNIKESVWNW